MARWKNVQWAIGGADRREEHTPASDMQASVAILMDLRDELQTLNRVFSCSQVQAGFGALRIFAHLLNEAAFKRSVENAVAKRLRRKARKALTAGVGK